MVGPLASLALLNATGTRGSLNRPRAWKRREAWREAFQSNMAELQLDPLKRRSEAHAGICPGRAWLKRRP